MKIPSNLRPPSPVDPTAEAVAGKPQPWSNEQFLHHYNAFAMQKNVQGFVVEDKWDRQRLETIADLYPSSECKTLKAYAERTLSSDLVNQH